MPTPSDAPRGNSKSPRGDYDPSKYANSPPQGPTKLRREDMELKMLHLAHDETSVDQNGKIVTGGYSTPRSSKELSRGEKIGATATSSVATSTKHVQM